MRVAQPEKLVLATVTVTSLKPKDLSRTHKYRVNTNNTIDQTDRELNLHGCHVVGVQESCIKGNVTREQQEFVAFTSGANGRGQLGIEAWVHSKGQAQTLLPTAVLKIDGKNINMTVIVAHAPPNDSGEQGRFWSHLRKTAHAVPLALLIDANERGGSTKSKFIGSCPSDTENANGSELRRVLEVKNLYGVSTFTPNYQATWWSGRAQHNGRRNDYIAVSDIWTDLSAKPSTMPASQLPGEATDHVPVRASMLWPQFCPNGAKHDVVGNGTLVVPRLQSNAEAQRWLQHYSSACIPKLVSLAQRGLIDEMYSTAHSTLYQCASFCFGMQKSAPKPKKPWTSQQTAAMSV